MEPRRRWPLHTRILVGMGLGLVAGLIVNGAQDTLSIWRDAWPILDALSGLVAGVNGFVGDLFLRALRFIAVPIVLFSLVVGASSLDDVARLGRIGGSTVLIYLVTTSVSISLGLALGNLLQPGRYLPEALRDQLAASSASLDDGSLASATAPDLGAVLLDILPTNPFEALASGNMLQVVATALILGIALTRVPTELAKPVVGVFEALNEAVLMLVHGIMAFAPIAVFALIAQVVAGLGLDVLGPLLVYTLTVVLGLSIMMFALYPTLLRALAGIGPRRFFTALAPAQLLAFSSSSSSATLPVTIECVEEGLGVEPEVASFVLPLGATINMDGTALYQGVAALFIAQLYGIDLTLADQLTLVLTATLASIGTAGVPGVGIVMLVIVLQSVGMPQEAMSGGIAIIFGVDRLLDMCRTAANVTGDATVACLISARERALAVPISTEPATPR